MSIVHEIKIETNARVGNLPWSTKKVENIDDHVRF